MTATDQTEEAINQALKAAGNTYELGRIAGCSQSMAWKMVNQGYATASYVLNIEKGTGVSRHDLRPDLYPRENAA